MRFNRQLPGADLVEAGLGDLSRGMLTIEGLLVLAGAPRLEAAGIRIPRAPIGSHEAEIALYLKIASRSPEDAHAQYNSLVQRLVSFENALDHCRKTRSRLP